MQKTSIKEYYTNLYKLYYNAVNMINGINQSLSTNYTNVKVPIIDDDNNISSINLPSFLYLDSKVQELSSQISSLMNLPKSGEAWLNNPSVGTFKINLVKSNVAPPTPTLYNTSTDKIIVSSKDNEFLSNFITPYTFLRLNLDNNNIDYVNRFEVKILTFESESIFKTIASGGSKPYLDTYEKIFNFAEEENISIDDICHERTLTINAPVKKSEYISSFLIQDVIIYDDNSPNPHLDADGKLIYDIIVDNISCTHRTNPAITHTLQIDDKLTLSDNYTLYQILNIEDESTSEGEQYKLSIKEVIGHTYLQTYQENNSMELMYYEFGTSLNRYIDIPLDNHEYIIIFVAAISNNFAGNYSSSIILDLNEVYMSNNDESNSDLIVNKSKISYAQFYKEYCKNYNEILQGLSFVSNSFPTQFTVDQIKELQESKVIKELIDQQFTSTTLTHEHINSHINDNTIRENINTYISNKTEYKNNISTYQSNIAELTKSLLSTYTADDYNSITQQIIQERTKLVEEYKKFSNVANSINKYKEDISKLKNAKYRIRGILNTEDLENYIEQNYSNVHIIGVDVEYKYKSNLNTEQASVIDNKTFSNWNKMRSIDKEGIIIFDDENKNMFLTYKSDTSENNIKWNQIDIPISENEIVEFRLRYKYSVGYPFITIYSPWSETRTQELDNSESYNDLEEKISDNEVDLTSSNIIKQLISDGYVEHMTDNVIAASNDTTQKTYLHSSSNVYYGINHDTNLAMSVKEKIDILESRLDSYRSKFDEYTMPKFIVYASINNNLYQLYNNSYKEITLPLQWTGIDEKRTGTFEILIKNTGVQPVKLYSIFNGINDQIINSKTVYINTPEEYSDGQPFNRFVYFREMSPFQNHDYQLDKDTNEYIQVPFKKSTFPIITKDNGKTEKSFTINFDNVGFDISTLVVDHNDDNTGLSYKMINENEYVVLKMKYTYKFHHDLETTRKNIRTNDYHYYLLFDLKPDPVWNKLQYYGIKIKTRLINEETTE